MIADDNIDSARSLAKLMKMLGNEVRTAHDGGEAVQLVEDFKADIVLLDIGMPTLNGYDACRQIRTLPGGKDIRLIALTGWGQENDRRLQRRLGFITISLNPLMSNHSAESWQELEKGCNPTACAL